MSGDQDFLLRTKICEILTNVLSTSYHMKSEISSRDSKCFCNCHAINSSNVDLDLVVCCEDGILMFNKLLFSILFQDFAKYLLLDSCFGCKEDTRTIILCGVSLESLQFNLQQCVKLISSYQLRISDNFVKDTETFSSMSTPVDDKESRSLHLSCNECQKQFRNKYTLKQHISTVHNFNLSKSFECKTCGKKFKRNSDLTFHINTIHGETSKYKCRYCDETFSTLTNRNRHERSLHIVAKKFQCSNCDKCFVRSDHQKVHSRICLQKL